MWNKQAAIEKIKPVTDKLVAYLKTKGIEFNPTDGVLENVILTKGGKEVKISYHSFYGFTRMGAVTRQRGEKSNEFDFVPVTDDVYVNSVLKQIIEFHFKTN